MSTELEQLLEFEKTFFDYLELLYNPIPYADLGAQETYGRHLVMPQDLPPMLAVLSAKSAQGARALTTDTSANLNVNLAGNSAGVGGGGGGGGGAQIYQSTSWTGVGFSGSGQTLGTTTGMPTLILGLAVGVSVGEPWVDISGRYEFWIQGNGDANQVHLAMLEAQTYWDTKNYVWSGHAEVYLPVPIDAKKTWPASTAVSVKGTSEISGSLCSGSLQYA